MQNLCFISEISLNAYNIISLMHSNSWIYSILWIFSNQRIRRIILFTELHCADLLLAVFGWKTRPIFLNLNLCSYLLSLQRIVCSLIQTLMHIWKISIGVYFFSQKEELEDRSFLWGGTAKFPILAYLSKVL